MPAIAKNGSRRKIRGKTRTGIFCVFVAFFDTKIRPISMDCDSHVKEIASCLGRMKEITRRRENYDGVKINRILF
jgi:hypothetical protein